MPHLRQDVLTGHWVIFAPQRSGRPNEFPLAGSPVPRPVTCPFCPGNEDQTLPEVEAVGRGPGAAPDSPGWRIRCVPNLYPALGEVGGDPAPGDPLRPRRPGTGAHEVIVCTPDHEATLADLAVPALAELLQAIRRRALAVAARAPGHFVLPFLNHGPEAGATLRHPHLQILALPEVPPAVAAQTARLADHRRGTRRCLACDLLAAEEAAGERVVGANGHWLALAPWASRFSHEVVFWPRRHGRHLGGAAGPELEALAPLLHAVLAAQRTRHGDHSFNLVFAGGPAGQDPLDSRSAGGENDFHWHVVLTPRLARLAGLETGSGFFINPVLPELAAAGLRGEGAGA